MYYVTVIIGAILISILILTGCSALIPPGEGPPDDVENPKAWYIGFQTAEAWVLSEGLVDEEYRKGAEGAYLTLVKVTTDELEWDREKILKELDEFLKDEGWNEPQRQAARRYAEGLIHRLEIYLETGELYTSVLRSLKAGADDALRMYGIINERE